jgi:putrescine transport system ATP-binding protein
MDHGKIVQVDTPARIYEAPANVYVADFIGDVNVIEGIATRTGDDRCSIRFAEVAAPITAECTVALTDGAQVTYAIRPEKINVTADKPADRVNAVEGQIIDIGYLGNISTYHVELPGGQMIKAAMTNSTRLDRRDFTWDDHVWLSWRETAGVVLTE